MLERICLSWDYAKLSEHVNNPYDYRHYVTEKYLKAIYAKDASKKFDPFYQVLSQQPSLVSEFQSLSDEKLDDMLFQFGTDINFIGEPSTKLDYELAYE